jgi:hypothetical protein
MAKKPEPPKPTRNVYKIAKKGVWLSIVEAPDKQNAIAKAAAEFKVDPIGDGTAMTPIRERRRWLAAWPLPGLAPALPRLGDHEEPAGNSLLYSASACRSANV